MISLIGMVIDHQSGIGYLIYFNGNQSSYSLKGYWFHVSYLLPIPSIRGQGYVVQTHFAYWEWPFCDSDMDGSHTYIRVWLISLNRLLIRVAFGSGMGTLQFGVDKLLLIGKQLKLWIVVISTRTYIIQGDTCVLPMCLTGNVQHLKHEDERKWNGHYGS